VQVGATPRNAVHGSRADHLLLRASHVEFCGVLYKEHDLLLRDPLPGGVDVWLKNLIESDLGIIEELIRGIRFQFPPRRLREVLAERLRSGNVQGRRGWHGRPSLAFLTTTPDPGGPSGPLHAITTEQHCGPASQAMVPFSLAWEFDRRKRRP